ncbi:MAG: site-specific integrase [Chloroflexi bacterium]|nr:site-specific integrase [Chloroflexota bacterium]
MRSGWPSAAPSAGQSHTGGRDGRPSPQPPAQPGAGRRVIRWEKVVLSDLILPLAQSTIEEEPPVPRRPPAADQPAAPSAVAPEPETAPAEPASRAPAPADAARAAALLARQRARAADLARRTRAPATARAYAADWADFAAWCAEHGLAPLPAAPDAVAAYLAALVERGRRPSTLQRRLAAIAHRHRAAGHPPPTRDPTVRDTLAGARRELGVAPAQKAALLPDDVRAMVAALPRDLAGLRDRALLVLGFLGAFRRAELVALRVEDIRVAGEGLVVTLRRSKTDQDGQGRRVALPAGADPATCPVAAYRAWRAAAGLTAGPVFRKLNRNREPLAKALHPEHVARLVKRAAAAVGLDPAAYAGHSLRAGLATAAALAGASDRAIMKQTGHTSREMVDRYIRDGDLFRDNAAARVGL